MSSVAYNLSRKLEWMARRLRHIDDAREIKVWVAAMGEINRFLKEFESKLYEDQWRPWGKEERKICRKKQMQNDDQCLGNKAEQVHVLDKKAQKHSLPTLITPTKLKTKVARKIWKRHQRTQQEKRTGIKEAAPAHEKVANGIPPQVDLTKRKLQWIQPKVEQADKDMSVNEDDTNEEEEFSRDWECWREGAISDSDKAYFYRNTTTGLCSRDKPRTLKKKVEFKGYRSFGT